MEIKVDKLFSLKCESYFTGRDEIQLLMVCNMQSHPACTVQSQVLLLLMSMCSMIPSVKVRVFQNKEEINRQQSV